MSGRILILALCAALAPWSVRAQTNSHADAKAMLREGTELFRLANEKVGKDPQAARDLYSKAVMRFESVAGDGGVRNGGLYYNIGNTYFRMEDLGRAILNYRRALLYTPRDPNLRQNLEYARSRRLDKIEVRQKTRILNMLFFWHYDLSGRLKSIVFACAFVLAWVLAGIRLFRRGPLTGWALGVAAGLAVIFVASLGADEWSMRVRKSGVVVSDTVTARKGDSENYEPSFTEPLHAGAEFDVVARRGEWYQAELADGRLCWIPVTSAELVK